MRGPLAECAENGSCIPVAPRSWGVGTGGWGGREAAGRRGVPGRERRRSSALRELRRRVPGREAGGGCSPRRRLEVSRGAAWRPGRGRGPHPRSEAPAAHPDAGSARTGLLRPRGERGRDGKVDPEKVHFLMESRTTAAEGGSRARGGRTGEVLGVCEGEARCQGRRAGWDAGEGDPRPGGRAGPVSAPGRGARGVARGGRLGRSCGGRGGGALGPSRPGRGGGGEPGAGPRRRRAGLAPDLTFWVRACVPEARWGRGWGREAVREVPGRLASAPFSLPLSPPPKGQALRAPGGKREGPSRPTRDGNAPGPGTPPWFLWGLLGEGAEVVAARRSSPPLAPPGSPGGASSEIGGGSVPG